MSTSRSDDLHARWRDSTEKFDYFILSVIGLLCAYISQNFKADRLGFNPGTVELLALLVLVLAAIFGFRRIEATNMAVIINHRVLHANERRGVLASVLQNGDALNTETGEIYTPAYAGQEIPKITAQIQQLRPELLAMQKKALRCYKLRNAFVVSGFLSLIAAKLYAAYV